jgi:hypothetical protein
MRLMHWRGILIILSAVVLVVILFAVPLGVLLPRGVYVTPTITATSTPTITITPTAYKYTILDDFTGAQMLASIGSADGFEYFTGADPTHGYVNYGAHSELLEAIGTKLKIDIGANIGQPRNAIRLERTKLFDSGLVVLDVEHIPSNLSSWPAFWTTGHVAPPSTWALNGEIDILEQVNNSAFNSCTLHTSTRPGGTGCAMDPDLGFKTNKCYAESGSKTCGYNSSDFCPFGGCSIDQGTGTFGTVFNNNLGGTFAMQLLSNGSITIWFWPRGETVPDFSTAVSDDFVTSVPTNTIKFTRCADQFSQQQVIINTTLCGDWAGASCCNGDHTWDNNQGCVDWVNSHTLDESFWLINYFQFYDVNF